MLPSGRPISIASDPGETMLMLRQMTDMPAGTIGFEAVGEVEDDDWEETVEPVLRREIADGRKVRLLYVLGPESRDVDGDAMKADTGFRARHASSFDRVAVVSDEDWMRPGAAGAVLHGSRQGEGLPGPRARGCQGLAGRRVGRSRAVSPEEPGFEAGGQRLAILLAMAMFVLVVDTSLMNVSIASVVEDLDTTVSGVQSAIALEALVSAAFILIGSKVGDLIGRKRAFVLGLLGYATGALAMALSQGLTAIIVFWAIIGGLGASLLLPAMQSLIHGNFQGAAQKKAYALVGAAAAIAAAVGPLVGGFLTTFLSWRVGFLLEVVVIAVVLSGLGRIRRRAVHGASGRRRRRRGAVGDRDGGRRDRHPRVAGGRGVRRPAHRGRPGGARVARLLAGAAQARGQADAARSRALPARRCSAWAPRRRCCRTSRSAER